MGGEAASKPPLRGSLRDAGGALKGVVGGGAEGGSIVRERISNRGDGGSAQRDRGGVWVEENRNKATAPMKNWEKMVALVRGTLGEGLLVEEAM